EGEPSGPQRVAKPAHRPSTEQRGQRLARQLTLRDERARWASSEPPPVGTCSVTGRQDNGRRSARLPQPRRHLKPVNTGKLNVEQAELRPQPLRLGDGRLAVNGLAHDLDPVRLKQVTGDLPEALVIVDDQDGERHQTSVPSPAAAPHQGKPLPQPNETA